MSTWLISALLQRSRRERWLLGLLALVGLPALVVFGLLLPLHEARQAAARDLQEARALLSWVTARSAEQSRLSPPAAVAPRAPIGMSGLEQSLLDSNLRHRVSQLSARSEGGIALRFDAVPFTGLMDWLSRQEPGWGYRIADLRITRSAESGIVAAALTLQPAPAE